jgi:hypothetical protein
MGMSASQARFLCLTARKNNVEFEGQQINQQRTTLSNESATYYSELCNMEVPTPPSIDDYTKVSYTFNDGAMTNTIISMLAKGNNEYSISYLEQWQDDYSIVTAASSLVMQNVASNGDTTYCIGNDFLRPLTGQPQGSKEYITINGKEYRVYHTTDENGADQPYYNEVINTTRDYDKNKDGSLQYILAPEGLTDAQTIMDYHKNNGNRTLVEIDGKYYYFNETDVNENKPAIKNDKTGELFAPAYEEIPAGMALYPTTTKGTILFTGGANNNYQVPDTTTRPVPIGATEIPNIYTKNDEDPYLKTLSAEELKNLMELEKYYTQMLKEKFGDDTDWYVRYVKNTTSGIYVPYFYKEQELQDKEKYNDKNLASISCFSLGSTTKTKEILNAKGLIEKDASGRYVAITLFDKDGNPTTYGLTTTTSTDEEAYNDAMNKYHFKQHEYDHKVQEINSKLEIIQTQDKQLELKLKQLDTEENAIQTEMDAVKKVISKNVESSFKTFNA